MGNKYFCSHCGKTVVRDSVKDWVKSYCTTIGKTVRLMKVRPSQDKRRKKRAANTVGQKERRKS